MTNSPLAQARLRAISRATAWLVALCLVGAASCGGGEGGGGTGGATGSGGGVGAGAGAEAGDGSRKNDASGAAGMSPGDSGGAGGASGDAGSSTSAGSAGLTGNGAKITKTIGVDGGSITLTGGVAGTVTIAIPAGAVAATTSITITETTDAPPTGYTTYSPVYKFEPEGTAFAKPISVTLPFDGDAHLATLFWSREGTTGYERVGGIPLGTTLTGPASHFSKGFIADGVDYTDPPDKSCVVSKLIEGRTSGYSSNVSPGTTVNTALQSSVAMFYTVDDCQGRPVTGLGNSDFAVQEDGTALSSEAVPTVLPKPGLTIFATLLLDMSSSTKNELQPMIDGARAFVKRLQANNNQLNVQISIELFSGGSTSTAWQAPTLDTAKLLSRLDALTTYTPSDPSSTNLYGAVIQGLSTLHAAEVAFEQRNYGGALTSGYVVLFTDGADTAGLQTLQQALTAETADGADQVLAVGLQSSPDYSASAQSALAQLANNGLISSDDPTTLARDFQALAARIAGQVTRTYLLGYCSPKRAGLHTVSVAVVGSDNQGSASYQFSASGFGPGCTADAFSAACTTATRSLSCGGLGCGACDDRTASCNAASGTCVSFCKQQNECGGAAITNAQGYAEICDDQPEATRCSGSPEACKNLTSDSANCGACGHACAALESCDRSVCDCVASAIKCAGTCVNPNSDKDNCGHCGRVCSETACTSLGCSPLVLVTPQSGEITLFNLFGGRIYWKESPNGSEAKSMDIASRVQKADLEYQWGNSFGVFGFSGSSIHYVTAYGSGFVNLPSAPAGEVIGTSDTLIFEGSAAPSNPANTLYAYHLASRQLSVVATDLTPHALDRIETDGTNVYWAVDHGDGTLSLMRIPLAGGPVVEVAPPQPQFNWSIWGQFAYRGTQAGTIELSQLDLQTGETKSLGPSIVPLAADLDGNYVVSQSGQSLVGGALQSWKNGVVEKLGVAPFLSQYFSLYLDAQYVYFVGAYAASPSSFIGRLPR